jgi:hypothetical protein
MTNSRIGTPIVDGSGGVSIVNVEEVGIAPVPGNSSAVALLARCNVAPAAAATSDCCYTRSSATGSAAAGSPATSSGAGSGSAAANFFTAYSATG